MGYSMYAFHLRVKTLLEASPMTQKELADKCGLGKSSLNDRIRGRVSYSIEDAFALAKAFGITLDELFSDDLNDVFDATKKAIMEEANKRAAKVNFYQTKWAETVAREIWEAETRGRQYDGTFDELLDDSFEDQLQKNGYVRAFERF